MKDVKLEINELIQKMSEAQLDFERVQLNYLNETRRLKSIVDELNSKLSTLTSLPTITVGDFEIDG